MWLQELITRYKKFYNLPPPFKDFLSFSCQMCVHVMADGNSPCPLQFLLILNRNINVTVVPLLGDFPLVLSNGCL